MKNTQKTDSKQTLNQRFLQDQEINAILKGLPANDNIAGLGYREMPDEANDSAEDTRAFCQMMTGGVSAGLDTEEYAGGYTALDDAVRELDFSDENHFGYGAGRDYLPEE